MKVMTVMCGIGAAAVLLAGTAVAEEEGGGSEVSVSVDLASSYVFRGVTFNDGAVLQPGVEVGGFPITFGVWGNLDIGDYNGLVADGQFSEIDLYASYDIPLKLDPLGLSVGYTEYVYPSAGGDADREVGLSIGLDTVLSPALDLYYGVDGAIDKSFYAELSVGHDVSLPADVKLSLGALVAYLSPDEGKDGFSHYAVSADLSWSVLTVGVAYIGQIDDDVLPDYVAATAMEDASLGYDTEVVGKIGLSGSF